MKTHCTKTSTKDVSPIFNKLKPILCVNFCEFSLLKFSSICIKYLQAPYFFPLMLFKMEKCSSPEVKLQVLQTIPKLATHKVVIQVYECLDTLFSDSLQSWHNISFISYHRANSTLISTPHSSPF